jgi:hypothetical protein
MDKVFIPKLRSTTSFVIPLEEEEKILSNLINFNIALAVNDAQYGAIVFAVSEMYLRITKRPHEPQWRSAFESALAILYVKKKSELINNIYAATESVPTSAHFRLALKYAPSYAVDIVKPFMAEIGSFGPEIKNLRLKSAQELVNKLRDTEYFATVLGFLAQSEDDAVRLWIEREFPTILDMPSPTQEPSKVRPLARVKVAPLDSIPEGTDSVPSLTRNQDSVRDIGRIRAINKQELSRRNTTEPETSHTPRQLSPTRRLSSCAPHTPRQLSPTRLASNTPRQLSPTRLASNTPRQLSPTRLASNTPRQPQNTLAVPMQKYGKRAHVPKNEGKR